VSFVVNVKGSGPAKVFTLKCTGANDGEEGVITSFQLESVALGTDADGNVTDAPVVVKVDAAKQDGSNLKGNTAKALDALERAIEQHGDAPRTAHRASLRASARLPVTNGGTSSMPTPSPKNPRYVMSGISACETKLAG
jgi:hypothetical protein